MSFALIQNSHKCWVCGDAAIGVSYSALCCRSCKVFFFRYYTKKFQCLKGDDNCKIAIVTRSQCKKCRLDKCFSVGMEKMPVKTEEVSNKISPLRPILKFHSFENIENFNFSKKISKFRKVRQHSSPFVLSGFECDQIARIRHAIDCAFENERNLNFNGYISNVDAVNRLSWPDMYARGIVNFCKNIIEFKMLPQDDQLMVLRRFVHSLLMVWISFLWDDDKNGFLIIESSGTKSYMLQYNQNGWHRSSEGKLKQQNRHFTRALNKQMENDVIIRDLLIAQLLFNPQNKLSNNEFIKYQHYLYTHLMKRYLGQKYGNIEIANGKFAQIMQLIEQLLLIKANCQTLLKQVCFAQLPELACEMFL